MARKDGAWNKILNFFGIVDDDRADDYQESEDSGYDRGARSSYTPPRRSANRPAEHPPVSRSYGDDRRPTRASQPGNQSGSSGRARTSNSRFAQQSSGYDYTTRKSRFNDGSGREASAEASSHSGEALNQHLMITLKKLGDCRGVIESLVNNTTVILTISADEKTHARAIDILYGATFALNASMREASPTTYLLAPHNVDIDVVE